MGAMQIYQSFNMPIFSTPLNLSQSILDRVKTNSIKIPGVTPFC